MYILTKNLTLPKGLAQKLAPKFNGDKMIAGIASAHQICKRIDFLKDQIGAPEETLSNTTRPNNK